MILKGLMLFWQLVPLPFFCGGLFLTFLPEKKKTLSVIYMSGLLLQFALFEIIAIPCVLLERAGIFYTCSNLFALLLHLCAAAGALCLFRALRAGWRIRLPEREDVLTLAFYGLYVCLLLFRLYMAYTRAAFDGDDAYYIPQSVAAVRYGNMYRIDPYTGTPAPLDIRHALAVLPMWEAHVARLSSLHPTVLAHSLLPLFLIPLTDLVWYLSGTGLLGTRKKQMPLFLSLMALFQMFASVSIYTAERFALTRTWQGKSLLANLVLPLLLWLFCWLFESRAAGEKEEKRHAAAPYLLLALTNLLAGLCTSMGIALAAGLTMLAGVFFLLFTRSVRPLPYLTCTVLVNLPYLVLYLGRG